MGVHVRISGQGCRELEDDCFFDWIDWFKTVREQLRGRFTRVDLAIDDEAYSVDFSTVHEAVKNKDVVRHGDSWDVLQRFRKGRFEQTLYLGSRTSEAMLRIYQKGLQLGGTVPWLRFEAEFKSKRAERWVSVLIGQGWDAAIGCIRSLWEFKDPEHGTTDRTRKRAAEWWVNLIGRAKFAFRLGEVAEQTWSKVQNWVVHQWAPMVSVLMEATGGDLSMFFDLAAIGEKRQTERHRRLIALSKSVPCLTFG
jgi:phage replication initiation protein